MTTGGLACCRFGEVRDNALSLLCESGVQDVAEGREVRFWAHSANVNDERHDLADHLRSTAMLARRFAEPFEAGDLAAALGLLHDAGKADCGWQNRLLEVEARGSGRVGGDHKSLGARLLANVAGPAGMAVLGHHGGLTDHQCWKQTMRRDTRDDEIVAEANIRALLPELGQLLDGRPLVPTSWTDELVAEMGVRLVFSALVDADHLDTAAHFAGASGPLVAESADMSVLVERFEAARHEMLRGRESSPIDGLRAQIYKAAVEAAAKPPGLFRLPAPTGSGKTMSAAAFGLHHAARYGKARVIVAVPFQTITEQNAQVYRDLLGADAVLEHHSGVEFDGRQAKLAAENWDAPFVVTTTVQLFDSLFGRKPARSRKVHRLANAVIVLDEVQALPITLLVPLLDALKLLTEHFGTTVLLASATQPAFEHLDVWRDQQLTPVIADPRPFYAQLRRVEYEWWLDPRPTLDEVADRAAGEHQALVVVNTTGDARSLYRRIAARFDGPAFHLSTRMYPAHRKSVLAQVRELLTDGNPVLLVSTQLIEAGVDVDFPVVYRALAPAESLQQAAGRANREGRRARPGRVVVFDAVDSTLPPGYLTAIDQTLPLFGPGKADPDDLDALSSYYRSLYNALATDRGKRGAEIQKNRKKWDFIAVAEGPLLDAGGSIGRDRRLAFRMIEDEGVPVVVTSWPGGSAAKQLVEQLRRPDGPLRDTLRELQPYIVSLPDHVARRPEITACCRPVLAGLDLLEWSGEYDENVGIDDGQSVQEVW